MGHQTSWEVQKILRGAGDPGMCVWGCLRVAHPGNLFHSVLEGHRILGISLRECVPIRGGCGPSSHPSRVTAGCTLWRGRGGKSILSLWHRSRILGRPSPSLSLVRVRLRGRTHSFEQTPTALLCPGSQRPSETPSSVECKGNAGVRDSQMWAQGHTGQPLSG